MTDALIVLAWVCACAAPGLLTGRAVYARARAKSMDKILRRTWTKYTLEEARAWYEEFERGEDYFIAAAFGFLWPVLGVGWWIGRWFEETAPESVEEAKARIRGLERENARLEKELGIGDAR